MSSSLRKFAQANKLTLIADLEATNIHTYTYTSKGRRHYGVWFRSLAGVADANECVDNDDKALEPWLKGNGEWVNREVLTLTKKVRECCS